MSSAEVVLTLKERARRFHELAMVAFERGYYDLAAFNLEQACQLLLKAELLRTRGGYPRTHSLVRLLRELGREEFARENIGHLTKLEDAYITSRYYVREFHREEIEELLRFYERFRAEVDSEDPLERVRRALRASGVREAYVFGSYASGGRTGGSDIDVLVVVEDPARRDEVMARVRGELADLPVELHVVDERGKEFYLRALGVRAVPLL